MKKILKLGVFLFLLSSCSSQIIQVTKKSQPNIPNYDKSQAFFIEGIGQTQEIDGDAICEGKGINRIKTVQTFMDVFLRIITIHIYTPRTLEIYCNS